MQGYDQHLYLCEVAGSRRDRASEADAVVRIRRELTGQLIIQRYDRYITLVDIMENVNTKECKVTLKFYVCICMYVISYAILPTYSFNDSIDDLFVCFLFVCFLNEGVHRWELSFELL